MEKQRSSVIFRPLGLILLTFLLITCSDFARAVRTVTYPPDFVYVDSQQLRSRMQRFGYELRQLDLALANADSENPELQQQVVEILRNIERLGSDLQAGDAGSNHPFLQDGMPALLADVRQARMGASLNPPRYYMAGRLSGACVNCHRINR